MKPFLIEFETYSDAENSECGDDDGGVPIPPDASVHKHVDDECSSDVAQSSIRRNTCAWGTWGRGKASGGKKSHRVTSVERGLARKHIVKRILRYSAAFSAFESTSDDDESSKDHLTGLSSKTLQAYLPDPELYPEEVMSRNNPIKGWSDMNIRDRFLFRWDEYCNGDETKDERIAVIKALGHCIRHADAAMSAIHNAQINASITICHYVPSPGDTNPPTPASLLEKLFVPLAAPVTEHVQVTAAMVGSLLDRLLILSDYTEFISISLESYSTLPIESQARLTRYMVQVAYELGARLRQYTTLMLFLTMLELKRISWLGEGRTLHARFMAGMKRMENVQECTSEMRVWIRDGGRVDRFEEWMVIVKGVIDRWEKTDGAGDGERRN